MKKQRISAICSLLFGLFCFVCAGDLAVAGQKRDLAKTAPKKSFSTSWQQAFPDTENGGGSKALEETVQFKKNPQDELLGRWICRTRNGDVTLNFISRSRLNFNGDPASYNATRDTIRVQADGRNIDYPYCFNDKGLLITFPEGFKALFVKDTAPASAAASGNIFPQLVGEWKDIRSSGNTVITLGRNGQYSYYSDYAAGNSAAGSANWGYSNADSNRGTWRAKGTPRAGTIFYRSQDGSSDTLSYQVHVENGRTYWGEYYFDGTIYVKQ